MTTTSDNGAALRAPGSTERTVVRRIPEKAVTDRAVANAILDAGVVAHLAVAGDEGRPLDVVCTADGDGRASVVLEGPIVGPVRLVVERQP